MKSQHKHKAYHQIVLRLLEETRNGSIAVVKQDGIVMQITARCLEDQPEIVLKGTLYE